MSNDKQSIKSIEAIDIFKLCSLARIDISDMNSQAQAKLTEDMNKFIEFAGTIHNALQDIGKLEPLYHPHDLIQPLRNDLSTPTSTENFRNKLMKIAPEHDEENYLVPKILD